MGSDEDMVHLRSFMATLWPHSKCWWEIYMSRHTATEQCELEHCALVTDHHLFIRIPSRVIWS